MHNDDRTPSTERTAFYCPHCGAFANQHWFDLSATQRPNANPLPHTPGPKSFRIKEREYLQFGGDADVVVTESVTYVVWNHGLSRCSNCRRLAVWVEQRMVFPAATQGPDPNADLPDEIIADYNEARQIVALSPRGAAALLRLCVQKLCKHLGEKGKNIDADIASLVKKGLDPRIQQALDILRVTGNEAVHPGTLDLKDDHETALTLFELLNAIADQMISHPKRVEEMYSKLPASKRDAIEKRDKKN